MNHNPQKRPNTKKNAKVKKTSDSVCQKQLRKTEFRRKKSQNNFFPNFPCCRKILHTQDSKHPTQNSQFCETLGLARYGLTTGNTTLGTTERPKQPEMRSCAPHLGGRAEQKGPAESMDGSEISKRTHSELDCIHYGKRGPAAEIWNTWLLHPGVRALAVECTVPVY